ncbi:hypothetical protein TgHK011_007423 [Trichoderma gracile]|nr:hypothetical protein TgHK011_007423 [Trichoderma gracile]
MTPPWFVSMLQISPSPHIGAIDRQSFMSARALSRPVPAFRSCARIVTPSTSTVCDIWLDDEVIVLSTSTQKRIGSENTATAIRDGIDTMSSLERSEMARDLEVAWVSGHEEASLYLHALPTATRHAGCVFIAQRWALVMVG